MLPLSYCADSAFISKNIATSSIRMDPHAMASNSTWFPPAHLVLDFEYCFTAVALWTFYDPLFSQRYIDHGKSFFDVNSPQSQSGKNAINLLLYGLSNYVDGSQLERPSDDEIWQWMKEPIVNMTVSDYVMTKCLPDRCTLLDWENDAEVTGTGASLSSKTTETY